MPHMYQLSAGQSQPRMGCVAGSGGRRAGRRRVGSVPSGSVASHGEMGAWMQGVGVGVGVSEHGRERVRVVM